MTVRWRSVRRLPHWPTWAVVVVTTWLGGVAAAHVLSLYSGREVSLCPMRRFAGIPCPTCGLTRASFLLLEGRLVAAVLQNPLFVIAGGVLLVMLAVRLAIGRAIELKLTPRERIVAGLAALAAVLANWAYVIVYVG